jgi:hypothetical protein
MPSKSRDIGCTRINGAQSNRSFYNNTTHSYLCGGCANNHLADVRIALRLFDNDLNKKMKISKILASGRRWENRNSSSRY